MSVLQSCSSGPARQTGQGDRPWFDPPAEPHWSERDLRMGWAPPPSPPVRLAPSPAARHPMQREPARPIEAAGSSWAVVFAHPGVDASERGAEYSRNDGGLTVRPDMPLLATNEWPERERASLAYPRYVYLNNRPEQLLFFENESRYRGGYGQYRTTPVAPEQGVWGFWR